MTGIYNSGGSLTPYYRQESDSAEQQPSAVYVNMQDGNGEQQVWPVSQNITYMEDWNDGATDWYMLTSAGTLGTQSTEPVSTEENLGGHPAPSDVYGYVSRGSAGYDAAENWTVQTQTDSYYQLYLRSGGPNAGSSESQFQFNCQQQNATDPNSRYRVAIFNGTNDLDLDKYDSSGKETLSTNTNVTIDGTEWALVEIKTPPSGGGNIEARVKNVSTNEGPWTVAASDPSTLGQGGIRISTYDGNGANETHFDGLREIDGFTI